MKYIVFLIFLSGCANVGPVEITDEDTLYTVLTAFLLAVIVFFVKGFIEYWFAKKLERYKKQLDNEE